MKGVKTKLCAAVTAQDASRTSFENGALTLREPGKPDVVVDLNGFQRQRQIAEAAARVGRGDIADEAEALGFDVLGTTATTY